MNGALAAVLEVAMADRSLVERARGGDHDAFAVLATLASARLDAAARLILRSDDAARDAVQEAFLRAWRDLPRLRELDRFDAWLSRLLANACHDQIRKNRGRVFHVDIGEIEPAVVDQELSRAVDRVAIERGLMRLDPAHRALVVLHFYLDLPLPEAAAALQIPLGTAKSRLHRSLRELRIYVNEPSAAPISQGRPA